MIGGYGCVPVVTAGEKARIFPLYGLNADYDEKVHSVCSFCCGYMKKAQAGGHARGCLAKKEKESAQAAEVGHDQHRSHSYHGNKGKAFSTHIHGSDTAGSQDDQRETVQKGEANHEWPNRARYSEQGAGRQYSGKAAQEYREYGSGKATGKKKGNNRYMPPSSQPRKGFTTGLMGSGDTPPWFPGEGSERYDPARNDDVEMGSEEGRATDEQTGQPAEDRRRKSVVTGLPAEGSTPLGGRSEGPIRGAPQDPRGYHDGYDDDYYDPDAGYGGNQDPPECPQSWALTEQNPPHDDYFAGLEMPNWEGLIYFESDQLRTYTNFEVFADVDKPKGNRDIPNKLVWPKLSDYRDMRGWSDAYVNTIRTAWHWPGLKLVPVSWEQAHVRELVEVQSCADKALLSSHFLDFAPGCVKTLTMSNFLLSMAFNWPEKLRSQFHDVDTFLAAHVPAGKPLVAAMNQLRRLASNAGIVILLEDPLHWTLMRRKIGIPAPVLREATRNKGPTYTPSWQEITYAAQTLMANMALVGGSVHDIKDLLTVAPAKIEISFTKSPQDLVCYNAQIDNEDLTDPQEALDAFMIELENEVDQIPCEYMYACVANLKTLKPYQWDPRKPKPDKGDGKGGKRTGKGRFRGFRKPRNDSTFGEVYRNRRSSWRKSRGKKKGKGFKKGTQAQYVETDPWDPDTWEDENEEDLEDTEAYLAQFLEEKDLMEVYYTFLPLKLRCLRCGQTGHQAAECQENEGMCWGCGKKGHTRAECKSSEEEKIAWDKKIRSGLKSMKAMLAQVEEELEYDGDDEGGNGEESGGGDF